MEQLGYIALGCILVLAVLGLRRIKWSKIKLPTLSAQWIGRAKLAPRTKNSVLLSIAVHAVLALIGALFIVTKETRTRRYQRGVGEDTAAPKNT